MTIPPPNRLPYQVRGKSRSQIYISGNLYLIPDMRKYISKNFQIIAVKNPTPLTINCTKVQKNSCSFGPALITLCAREHLYRNSAAL